MAMVDWMPGIENPVLWSLISIHVDPVQIPLPVFVLGWILASGSPPSEKRGDAQKSYHWKISQTTVA